MATLHDDHGPFPSKPQEDVVERFVDWEAFPDLASDEKLLRTVGSIANDNSALMEAVVCSEHALDARKLCCASITNARCNS